MADYCISDYILESKLNDEDVTDINIGIGELKLVVVDDSLTYQFIPSKKLETMIVDAYQKEITVWGLHDIEENINLEHIGLKGSPTKVKKSYPKQGKGAGTLLKGMTAEEIAQAILAKLKEKYII